MDDDSSDGGASPDLREVDQPLKRRRLHGACDTCRRKKIKCNSSQMPGNVCSNCVSSNLECTHDTPRQPKKDSQKNYIRALEQRLDKMENLLRRVNPEGLLTPTVASSPEAVAPVPTVTKLFSDLRTRASPPIGENAAFSQPSRLSPNVAKSENSSDEDDLAQQSLTERLSQLSVEAVEDRFFGQSSSFMLVQHAANIKSQLAGTDSTPLVSGFKLRRPLYWNSRPWERAFAMSQLPRYVYPDQDLTESLISLYFTRCHPILPVIHRPTFESAFKSGLHLRDTGFGMTLLMVCAVASRHSMDPRVLLDEDPSGLSCGWKYFRQIPIYRNSLVVKASIYDMQYYCLAVAYLLGTSIPQAGWGILALGIRLAQERGVHRRKGPLHKITAEDEMWRRGLWCLLLQDRIMSAFVGRPCAMRDEDFDIDFPIECDDEYWETNNPANAFKQPAGKPSLTTALVYHLKLCEILAFTLRALYSTKKSKILSGLIGKEWEERVVAELDSALNQWRDSLPDHLRWGAVPEDSVFFQQSVSLHATFYYVQIQVHRPFLQKVSPHSFPSLAICTNAARSCIRMLATAAQRGIWPSPNIFMSAFASGIVLLMNLWAGRRARLHVQADKEVTDVQKCIEVLTICEKRWHIAGRLSDMLTELSCIRDTPLPLEEASSLKKRRRDSFAWEVTQGNHAATMGINVGREPMQPVPVGNVIPEHSPPVIYTEKSPFHSVNSQDIPPCYQPQTNVAPYNAMMSNDWELSNLLLAQMAYMQSLPPPIPFAGDSVSSSITINPQNQQDASGEYLSTSQPTSGKKAIPVETESETNWLPSADEDAMAIWLNAPSAFDVEEWGSYIASIGLSNMNTEGSSAQFDPTSV